VATLGLQQAFWLLLVNLIGAAFLGFIQVNKRFSSEASQSFWGTGVAGGFTTLSGLITFATLGNDPNFYYAAVQIILGILVYWIGRILGGERPWSNS
jgi:fluoride ion exporter CrcB/FEX